MKILYLGSGAFGLPTLDRLARTHTVVGVITQPHRPAGRDRQLTPTPVGAWAKEHLSNVSLLTPEDINEPRSRDGARSIEADAWVVIAYGQKLSDALLADRFAINLHASLLPRWRGAAPINHAIIAGDALTGNSVITVVNKMDAGLVLGQSKREIPADITAGDLHDLLSSDGPDLLMDVLDAYGGDRLVRLEQDESLVTRAGKLKKSDGWVDFAQSAEQCRRRINGLSPWPGVDVGFRDGTLRLVRANCKPGNSEQPAGTIADPDHGLITCQGGGILQLLEVQPPGKRSMQWKDFAQGRTIGPGERLTGGSAC